MWDHIKNGGDHGAENYELTWVGNLGGMRESRRLMGDYVLTEQDILSNRVFEDAVAYGGWPMDEHVAAGFRAKGQIPSRVRSFKGLYSIPYGCFCSRTVKNLMMAGRNISASKLAMGSTRWMGTCAVGGEAVGVAAAGAALCGLTPSEYGHLHRLSLIHIYIFHFGSLSATSEPSRSATCAALEIARKAGCIITYDPNYRAPLWKSEREAVETMLHFMPYADILKVSEEEMELLTGTQDIKTGSRMLADYGITLVCVSRGALGACFRRGDRCV